MASVQESDREELSVWRRLRRGVPGGWANHPTAWRGRVRLRDLSNMRWTAIGGQSSVLFLVYFGLNYRLPLLACAIAIALSAAFNLLLAIRYPPTQRLSNLEATAQLVFDTLVLGVLLYLTGGITNPFAVLFLVPVVIAAYALNLGNTLLLAALALVSVSIIAVYHEPLPWAAGETLHLPALYQGGMWSSVVTCIVFTSIYAWRIASEASRMQSGLAATQLALSHEHRMASLGALATAAAHELGTPLATIAVVARELERALPPASPEAEDLRLLRAEAERCRGILTRLARPEESLLAAAERLPLGALLDEIANEYRGGDMEIRIDLKQFMGGGAEPKVWRVPEILHGLGNLVANAADFADAEIRLHAEWGPSDLRLAVEDDGPGFAPEILERIGEPYVTSRPGLYALEERELSAGDAFAGQQGMGLGFFIAKTLIEQTGGTVKAGNMEQGGARVEILWPRGAVDGERRPGRMATV